MPKYLCLQRSMPGGDPESAKPSPAQMQAMYATFNAWREKFQKNLTDLGGRLGPLLHFAVVEHSSQNASLVHLYNLH